MKLPNLNFNQMEMANFDEALQKEWLITNGLGGYASSTILGVNTRKYQGLLVAAMNPPANRTVCLAKVGEEIDADNQVYLLGANEFQGAIFPQGYKHLQQFSVSPFPEYNYKVAEIAIKKTIFMPYLRNAVVVIYEIQNNLASEAKVKVTPLVTCRHYHSTMSKVANPPFSQTNSQTQVQIAFPVPKIKIAIRSTKGEFFEKPNWIDRIIYREDEMRHESGVEDCYQPGFFQLTVPANGMEKFALIASAEENNNQNTGSPNLLGTSLSDVEAMFSYEKSQKEKVLKHFYKVNAAAPVDWLSWVQLAADAFMVRNGADQKSVIAGYHWYEAWGRDTFVSLPGLMLVTGRFNDAKNVLSTFNGYCKQGLIPNFVGDKSGEPAYNTVDATLWFVNAVLQYLKYTGDFAFVRTKLWDNLKAIVENHVKGTVFNIHVDSDGLLAHGERLTWMDARVNGQAMTPRTGKAVEIQALWFNAVKTVQLLADRFGEHKLAEEYGVIAENVKSSFEEKFWNSARQCLFDVVGDSEVDASLRPNQVIAAALDFHLLNPEVNRKILDAVQRELLTPCGLRTLERGHPKYRGVYFGDRWTRDTAYHNGTVWPWLLGPFTAAYLKSNKYCTQSVTFISGLLSTFLQQRIAQAGLGTISEIFDGDAPHVPRGCIAQAWSIGETLRAYVEGALQVKPKFEREVLGV